MSSVKQISKKIIAIVGTTASGKTGLGVKLAYKFKGEIISADSRQVYKGMDVGTGKDLAEYIIKQENKKTRKQEIIKIPYHLIDVVEPTEEFNLAKFQKLAYEAIEDIMGRGKLPIIVGGTGLYVQALVDNYKLPEDAKPDKELREKLEELSAQELYEKLLKENPKFAKKLNNSDRNNKRRLIRYLEVVKTRMATNSSTNGHKYISERKDYEYLIIGLTWPKEVLHERIYKRLIERLEQEEMIGEVDGLHSRGVSWQRLESFGLEYKYIALYLQEKLDYDEMVEYLHIAIKKFAKRQLTWLRRWERQGAKIHWVGDKSEAKKLADSFLK